jgi:hypothetical protein
MAKKIILGTDFTLNEDRTVSLGSKTFITSADAGTTAADTTPLVDSAGGSATTWSKSDHAHQSPGGIAALTSQVSIANSNTETQLLGATIPANLQGVGTTFRIVAHGTVSTYAIVQVVTLRARIGSTTLTGNTILSFVLSIAALVTGKWWHVDALCNVETAGVNGGM